jgi:stage II sporulation protein D
MMVGKRTATFVLAAALLAPATAQASWTIEGRGFGHGVGLSQYGAYGFAQNGRGYQEILGHYYRDTTLGKAAGRRIRVLLGSSERSIAFTGARRACGKRISRGGRYSFGAEGRGVVLRDRAGAAIKACGARGKAGAGVRIAGFGAYRGSLLARNDGGSLQIINAVGAQGYVKGVVANEMPSSWPAQALRAQAVVARSYGLATARSGPFDHYADTRSQVYRGKASETEATNRAVSATANEVVEYRGEPAATFFFSSSGGQTESSEFGFAGGDSIAYLRSVEDPFDDASPEHQWTERLSDEQMESELTGLFAGRLERIEVLERGDSPRIVRARVVGSADSTAITGATLRARLELRSTWARFVHEGGCPTAEPGPAVGSQPSGNGCTGIPWSVSRTPSSYAAAPPHSSRTSPRPLRSTTSSRSEIEQLSVLCSGPLGSA